MPSMRSSTHAPRMTGDVVVPLAVTLSTLPIVVLTGKDLSVEEELRLRRMAQSIVIKGVQSPERLLDETALFLHRVVTNLPAEKQRMLERLHQTDAALVGKKVLVVDDDVRNIFALTGLLERHNMRVVSASNGRSGRTKLSSACIQASSGA